MPVQAPVGIILERRQQHLLCGVVQIREIIDDKRPFRGALECACLELAVGLTAAQLLLGVSLCQRSGRDADQGLVGTITEAVQVAGKCAASAAGFAADQDELVVLSTSDRGD